MKARINYEHFGYIVWPTYGGPPVELPMRTWREKLRSLWWLARYQVTWNDEIDWADANRAQEEEIAALIQRTKELCARLDEEMKRRSGGEK